MKYLAGYRETGCMAGFQIAMQIFSLFQTV